MKLKKQPLTIHILLADNDPDDQFFFKEALKEFPTETELTTVHDGEELIQLLNNETNPLPDVLFLDLNMPRKNGFECLAEIKANEKLKYLPVIIYSTSYHRSVADMLYENGATHYISKPTEISKLKKAIHQILSVLVAEGQANNSENVFKPTKATFLVTEERKNYRAFSWFNEFFIIPFEKTVTTSKK